MSKNFPPDFTITFTTFPPILNLEVDIERIEFYPEKNSDR